MAFNYIHLFLINQLFSLAKLSRNQKIQKSNQIQLNKNIQYIISQLPHGGIHKKLCVSLKLRPNLKNLIYAQWGSCVIFYYIFLYNKIQLLYELFFFLLSLTQLRSQLNQFKCKIINAIHLSSRFQTTKFFNGILLYLNRTNYQQLNYCNQKNCLRKKKIKYEQIIYFNFIGFGCYKLLTPQYSC
ncbi:transmembrane protein, putative (macronuclear) [Tetrahymena thermophila SB210]|uniref:Transmembrane protein, putative n=1 Tax=Tetrahymena thermophila (strain SB210) TaxID=312017 RepID=W7XFT2_TETTS|nr:transmembrane protein, putative [Tetrahymena thermophila SB210]EWS75728.1 transmembrane protein, putative [Tetrahymena thermophila SB210]|eukprot:XP_012651650.1 transmembrane protein, putative [Tetrahymena thermophila SB210]